MNDAFKRLIDKVVGGAEEVPFPCRSKEHAEKVRDRFYYERRKLRQEGGDEELTRRAEEVLVRVEDRVVIFSPKRDEVEDLISKVVGGGSS